MKKRTKGVLAVAGVIFAITGGVVSVPLMIDKSYIIASLFIAMMIAGLIMFALGFGDY